ncbi:hypothetical protein A2160_04785 [Candidatus Beckwithbacteria bacterium RBG_13_42_9]|uniref:Antitoxin n=1 Tax=Candidatus Beckwithbacteria bacterium RBG_13_42_9 TaxID=1797457 RepID=A0A1F5E5V5_9BACT|nr:MAG: hypothetical protein A2160_04785 [Candidatus Beckwithbacteria bacterium RBG_13_42_9]
MNQTISIKQTREKLAEIVNQVAISKKTFVITKFGKPKALIIPVDKFFLDKQKNKSLPGFGMWQKREDMKNSVKWVSDMRKQWAQRHE